MLDHDAKTPRQNRLIGRKLRFNAEERKQAREMIRQSERDTLSVFGDMRPEKYLTKAQRANRRQRYAELGIEYPFK